MQIILGTGKNQATSNITTSTISNHAAIVNSTTSNRSTMTIIKGGSHMVNGKVIPASSILLFEQFAIFTRILKYTLDKIQI